MPVDLILNEIIGLERSALDRWIHLDPRGYLDLYSLDVTYFDPFTDSRVDGRDAIRVRMEPMLAMQPPFSNPRYEMLNPQVQQVGGAAVLTFNLVNYGTPLGGQESVLARWNATEVYGPVDGQWKIIHSHWSFVQPQVNPPQLD